MAGAITDSIDVAQVVLYVFWIFFFGLIFWLRREDRREGYPLENDTTRKLGAVGPNMIPKPKTFVLPHDEGTYEAPNFERDERPINAERTGTAAGWPLRPVGEPLLAGVGPSSYAQRSEHPELTRDGRLQIVPMRVATEFGILGGADPRGWQVIGGDKKVAGVIKDIWVDRADLLVRYLELEVEGGGRRLIPLPILSIDRDIGKVRVSALLSHQFSMVPTTQDPDKVTIMEEERISAFYAGGRLYAEPKRQRPLV